MILSLFSVDLQPQNTLSLFFISVIIMKYNTNKLRLVPMQR